MIKPLFIFLKMRFKLLIFILFISLLSCSESEYSKLVKTEMAKGIIHDSLFLGMKLGQTQKEFFDKCWKLNNKGIVAQGPSNKFVQYKLPIKEGDGLKHTITMLFYGIFNEDRIMTGMNMQFSYDAWSLWNKSLQSDQLIPVVKDSLKTWFPGNEFLKVEMEKGKAELFVKIDGNRRVTIKPLDEAKIVKAQIDDLRYILNE